MKKAKLVSSVSMKSMKGILLLAVFVFFTQNGILCENTGQRPPVRLEDILSPDYDSFQTPKNKGKPADVSIQIEILNIRSVDVSEMSFIADIFLYKTWADNRLKYPADRSIEKLALNPEWRKYLWTPDVYFHNAIEGRVQNTIIPYVYLWLKNDSTVVFSARLSLQFSCDMLLSYFPHDTQYCDIIVKSLTHTLNEMDLHWSAKDPITVGDFIILPQFELLDPIPDVCTKDHMRGKHGKFACLRGVIKLTRRCGYYVINIYIPTVLIVFMSMLTFWIPADAVPGRVTLGVTSLLTVITKQYQASLPSVSYVVALNVWLSCCIGFVFCSLLEYAAVIAILSHQKRMANETVKGTVLDTKSPSKCISLRNHFLHRIEHMQCHNIDRFCRVMFPLVFALLCIIYWAHYAT